jgi:hypothetical protein
MATLASAAAIAACNAIVDLVDAGSPPGNLIVTTVSGGTGTTLATLTLNNPAFGDAVDAGSAATATLDVSPAVSDTSADNTGTAAGFALRNAAGTAIITGSVATSGGDIDIDNASIVAGQTVNLTALTVSVPEASA